ncbi:hypothetical protein E4631_25375 [Hymenobacter sp. UV11]|uniref:hypothetical protein n=1 Tax=Hymenobacter sp. UV11 TaxID=1849735 RepID=UPI00105F1E37|nr:hypothetical protein [Hymenobacter sp. UV11]TDN37823.1 hypothetical protein A8B98_01820 [Hymenobacter sp. UV11]TFZ62293.1 hypothetical protein E4631_25375 [Hymenobacter sp. UV11]
MKLRILLLVLLPSVPAAFAQTSPAAELVPQSASLVLASNSSLIYPGLKVGVEFPLRTAGVTRPRKAGAPKVFTRALLLTTSANWYHHPTFHDNTYLALGLLNRRTTAGGFFRETSAEIGLSRTFLGGTTYQVTDEGRVSIERAAGHYYGVATVGAGLGHDFGQTGTLPLALYSKLNLLVLFPSNSTLYVRPTLEIGLVYTPAQLLRRKVWSIKRG